MFVNFTNHSSDKWGEEQLNAARVYGEIVDIAFPEVPSEAASADVDRLADEYVQKISKLVPEFVLCQGEFCLAFNVAEKLKARGIRVGAACSERCVTEHSGPNGTEKTLIFRFVQFREY